MNASTPPAPRATGGHGRAPGFTLIELMVVIVILGLLVALVGPNIWQHFVKGHRGAASAQMSNFGGAISVYYLDKHSLPQTLDELTQADTNGNVYMDKIPKDPWGQPYEYKVMDQRKQKYEIVSSGDDKTMGTEDDLFYPSRDEK